MNVQKWTPRRLEALGEREIGELAAVLVDCVEGGASVNFMKPFTRAKAEAFWRRIADDVRTGRRWVLAVDDAQGICGTVQLVLDMPDNQPHRGEVAKMLVHRRARRKGAAASLMLAAESAAKGLGKTLLVLDTVTGSEASRLYERLGWERAGSIPDYALMPEGGLCATTFYYRRLG